MGGPWLSSCFIFVIIIQHDDAVNGGHGGSNPPEGGSVGDFRIPAGRGWGLRESPSSIAHPFISHIFQSSWASVTPSPAQQWPHCLSSATIRTLFWPFTTGAPNHLKTLSSPPPAPPLLSISSLCPVGFGSSLSLIRAKLILPSPGPPPSFHSGFPRHSLTDTTPPSAPPREPPPSALKHVKPTPSPHPEESPPTPRL